MKKTLSLDLGTASIGWALRANSANPSPSDILAHGVVIFPEGYGVEKGNEFSLASARTQKRQIRRQLYRRKLRKYAVLALLIEHEMVPLSRAELRAWIKPEKGQSSQYPTNPEFIRWTRLLPKEGGAAFSNIYQLRVDAIYGRLRRHKETGFTEKQLLGRVFYNYAQRRGFKSNAKGAQDNETGKVKEGIGQLEELLAGKYLAEYFSGLNPFEERIRSRYIGREQYVREFEAVCENNATLVAPFKEKLHKALFFVRPLRSQKEKVGNCPFEPLKKRIHLSHPLFEEFRLRQFLQNIRFTLKGEKRATEKFTLSPPQIDVLVQKVIEEKEEEFSKKDLEKWISQFWDRQQISISGGTKFPASACPVSHALGLVKIENAKGEGHKRSYVKGKKTDKVAVIGREELWHFLKEVSERPEKFALERPVYSYAIEIGLTEEAAKILESLSIPSGYASLSRKAINRILPFMQEGYPYHMAVLLAGVRRVLGEKAWAEKGDYIASSILESEQGFELERAEVQAYNHFLDKLRQSNIVPDEKELDKKLKFFLGRTRWNEIKKENPEDLIQLRDTLNKRLMAASTEPEQASFRPSPSLQNLIREIVTEELEADGIQSEEKIKQRLAGLYHHSIITRWQDPKIIERVDPESGEVFEILQLPTPYTGAVQNPAAMRALHELKKLLNFLLREGQIDGHTKIVLEMGRELNESNKRKAILEWNNQREAEKQRIRHFLASQLNQQNPSEDQIAKTRIWVEQIPYAGGENERRNLDKQYLGSSLGPMKSDKVIQMLELWKEQKGVCLYSGRQLSISDILFGDVQIEHTIPRSLSNDSRMENLTLADGNANRLKGNRIPSQISRQPGLDSIEEIRARLKPWEDRIVDLEKQIKNYKKKIRGAKSSGDKEGYDKHIKNRWLLRFEKSYWSDKVRAFYLEEVDQSFARRQLVDTQVITKYAAGWLRTVFPLVVGTKGSLTAELRKQWGLQVEYEKKDRTQHTHHFIDAAVNAFIEPSLYSRLAEHFRSQETTGKVNLPAPWQGFGRDINALAEETLVYHVHRDRYKVHSQKRLKGGGFTHGKGYRARLHKETALGNVRFQEYDDLGRLTWAKDQEGEEKRGFVVRKDILSAEKNFAYPKLQEYRNERKENLKTDFRIMPVYSLALKNGTRVKIAELRENQLSALKENEINSFFLKEVAQKGIKEIQQEGFFIPMKKARTLRTDVASPPQVKTYPKAFQHEGRKEKHPIYFENDGNYALGLYRNHSGKKEKRTFIVLSHLDMAQGDIESLLPRTLEEKGLDYHLDGPETGPQVFVNGGRVLLFEKSAEEIWEDLSSRNLKPRMFKISGISSMTIKQGKNVYPYGTITLLSCHETGKTKDEKGKIEDHKLHKGVFEYGQAYPKRMFLHTQINSLIEGVDFRLDFLGRLIKL